MKGLDYQKSFGVDLDTKDKKLVKFYVDRMLSIGSIIQKYETTKGWHFKVRPNQKMTLKLYIIMRDYCGDDPRRIVKDIVRIWSKLSYDHLFMAKFKGQKIYA
tara:strand:- start:129 stop:437 length:309 start_codon:yes stop_codon:yes gene_type:complete